MIFDKVEKSVLLDIITFDGYFELYILVLNTQDDTKCCNLPFWARELVSFKHSPLHSFSWKRNNFNIMYFSRSSLFLLMIVPIVSLWESENFRLKIGLLYNFSRECNGSDDSNVKNFRSNSFELVS